MNRISTIPKEQLLEAEKVPSYFNYSQAQFDRLRFTLEQLKSLAGNRPVMVYSIPIEKEIKAYREHGKNPLGAQLQAVCDSLQVEYLDLLPKTNRFSEDEYKALFLSCDGHWSAKGNAFAKKEIESFFSYYQ
jgi:hypothetical protein